jgi:hypothetical protein
MSGKELKIAGENISWIRYHKIAEVFFGFACPPDKNNTVSFATSTTNCRETLAQFVTARLGSIQECSVLRRPQMRINRLHLIIHIHKAKLDKAIEVLNVIEKELGWVLTKAHELKIVYKTKAVPAVVMMHQHYLHYVTATNRWMKSPHLLSLFVLLLRSIKADFPIGEASSIDKLFVKLRRLSDYINFSGEINSHGEKTGFSIPVILKNYSKLFGNRSTYDLFNPSTGPLRANEGIRMLSRGTSADTELVQKIKKIEQEHNG